MGKKVRLKKPEIMKRLKRVHDRSATFGRLHMFKLTDSWEEFFCCVVVFQDNPRLQLKNLITLENQPFPDGLLTGYTLSGEYIYAFHLGKEILASGTISLRGVATKWDLSGVWLLAEGEA